MDFLSDIIVASSALGAAVFCLILSRRLRAFSSLDSGMGGAVAILSAQVDDLTRALKAAQDTARKTTERLEAQSIRAEAAARKLELLLAAMHDLPAADDRSAQNPAPGSTHPRPPTSWNPSPRPPPRRRQHGGGQGRNSASGPVATVATAPRRRRVMQATSRHLTGAAEGQPSAAARAHRPDASIRRQRPAARVPSRPRILPVLALMFLAATFIRLVSGVGTALAADSNSPAPVAMTTNVDAQPSARASQVGDRAAAELLIEVTRREEALHQREASVIEREQALRDTAAQLEAQLATLLEAERALAATMALADRAAEDDIGRMVAVFESMKADEAALVFTEMDPDFAAGFLARLPPNSAAAIMAGLDPSHAYHLSAIVAGRNALVPRR